MHDGAPPEARIPRWLRFVLASDRAGSAWYIGTGFFFAPVLAVLSPWPAVTAVLWAIDHRADGIVTSLTAEAASFFSRRVGVKGQSGP
jgi:hypothetical protein